ncbi:hypothetical protein Pst134EA_018945 [Puccinia striiformis f. sp. tritici]|uniref:Uncharacterized protein n=1 Tax=Puccinia striiformis f. sp. tritici PST-78 TaxID=1165861 RepID=A0A0L0UU25_9BASI|nr:hypothetical protein Pst134EA_018945 [Puccinia striiformis f. sp. tritici]KAH9448997.1 hypothetical protein Pst134EB_019838 [Puccinia striiformis f. sp. tritici]KAH9458789.1 hypothetical protein Pst134EA_018945 [Puccinia striiformis f. sp. tritici]KAI9625571.1 hypothetical protein KEM48_010833 [Puccinia striiformis f. sp. tritici PST-130]KNE90264.1 hypothetical protein PSTG_16305 [Puccinia striiformis f. sp. tritici PST-78]
MLNFSRLIALVLLVTSLEVAGEHYDPKTNKTYFGCNANIDAVCSDPGGGGKTETLAWAERLNPKKRDYACPGRTRPQCCRKDVYAALSHGPLIVTSPPPNCHHGSQ